MPTRSMFGEPRPNGLACPKCGEQLLDTTPNLSLDSFPPQKNVHCECGYHGFEWREPEKYGRKYRNAPYVRK